MNRSVLSARRGGTSGLPGWVVLTLALAVTCLCPAGAATVGDKAASRSAEALEHYNQGRFSEAVEMYRQAQIEDPDSHDLLFNVGDALYKQEDFEAAGQAFEETSSVPSLSARSYYNLGNTLFQEAGVSPGGGGVQGGDHPGIRGRGGEGKSRTRPAHAGTAATGAGANSRSPPRKPSGPGGGIFRAGTGAGPSAGGVTGRKRAASRAGGSPCSPRSRRKRTDNRKGSSRSRGQMRPEEAEQLLDAFADSEQEAQRRRFRVEARAQVKDW